MSKGRIAVIVEGAKREKDIFYNIGSIFFADRDNLEIVTLPAGLNIYMLSQQMKEDAEETDIIEVLKEYNTNDTVWQEELSDWKRNDFQEIYLFFDFDRHTNNLPVKMDMDSALWQMMDVFDNETENGKLYISYPMVEALRDIPAKGQECFLHCCVPVNIGKNYKNISSYNFRYNQFTHYNLEIWYEIIRYYRMRLSCFWSGGNGEITYRKIYNEIDTRSIHRRQQKYFWKKYKVIFILSAFPLFLLEYFGEELWKKVMNE